MRGKKLSTVRAALAICALAMLAGSAGAAVRERVLHSFNENGTDGYDPIAGLAFDASGNLYGTTYSGGLDNDGTVFELTPLGGGKWTESVLYNFSFYDTQEEGMSGLIIDASGNLYGTTFSGGAYSYYGTVFELTPTAGGGWSKLVLHDFNEDGVDGVTPSGGLTLDASGNLYGTTDAGGAYNDGTVFELTPAGGGNWTERVLYNFGGPDGHEPLAGLTLDGTGNLYGTTAEGGAYGYGTVFELSPAGDGEWSETVLHSFSDRGWDGRTPFAGLALDASGNLYGTTFSGGCFGDGTVFELTPRGSGSWTETVLHNFNGNGGNFIVGGVIADAAGNLYGTAYWGGRDNYGIVFELTPAANGKWREAILHNFKDTPDGVNPGGLMFDTAGHLYGTTAGGGADQLYGTVFEIMP